MQRLHIKKKLPPKKCIICGRLSKPLRKGRCHPCNTYLTRRKKERPYLNDGRIEKANLKLNKPCPRCGRDNGIVGRPIKGFCVSCYTYLGRKKSGDKKAGQNIAAAPLEKRQEIISTSGIVDGT
jgi:hypothetical protein